MDYKKFIESKLGSLIGKSKFVRVLIMKLYIRQQNKRKIALVPEHQGVLCNKEDHQKG